MTPNQIIPGTLYRHKSFPDTIYLGCCQYFGKNFYAPSKHFMLILKQANTPKKLDCIKVYYNTKDADNVSFWKAFYKAENNKAK